MNRFIAYIILFISTFSYSYAQTFEVYSQNHLNVESYGGNVSADAFTLVLSYSGTDLNILNWKLSVKLLRPIKSEDQINTFPADKISLLPVRTGGEAQNPGPLPTVNQIGMPSPVPLNESQEMYLVPSSNIPLYNVSQYNSYYRLELFFNLAVAGGAYLSDLQWLYWPTQRNGTYSVPLQFTVSRSDNSVIATHTVNFAIRVQLNDSPPPEHEYSIRISTDAANGVLEFKHLADYVNGKSVVYSNGLTVTSNTDYQVTVRALSPEFSSSSANKLPLDVVKLELQQGVGDKFPVSLSQTAQPIVKGPTTNSAPVSFDIRYYTIGDDRR
ncbi:MAG TPA: hypothetical protein DDZ78_07505, partial [Porphyromonadaceae bacterium]|nr:hypothetical protein [Porphyromonadaceae bacterium]